MLRLSIFYLFVRVANGVLAVATLYFLTRVLTGAEYGKYALVSAAAMFLATAGFQWINVSLSRFHAEFADREGMVIRAAATLYLWIALPIALLTVGALLVPVLPRSIPPEVVVLAGFGSIALAGHALGLQLANARQSPRLYGLISLTKGGFGLILALALISAGLSWQGAALGFLVAAGVSILLLTKDLRSMSFKAHPGLSSEMLRYGLPLSATFISSMVLDLSSRFIIGLKLDESSVAGYSVGYDLTQQVFGAAMNAVYLAAFPQIVKSYQSENVTVARAELRKMFDYLAIGSPILLGVFLGLSHQIASVTFGASVRELASQVIPLIAVGVFVSGVKSYYLDVVFQLRKRTEMQFLTTGIMAVINVAATLVLLDRFGVVGAAVSAVLAFCVGAVVSFCLGRREELYVHSGTDALKIIAVTIAVFAAARQGAALAEPSAIQGLLSGVVFAFGVYGLSAYCVDLGGCRKKISAVLGVRE